MLLAKFLNNLFKEGGFEQKLSELQNRITNPIFHEVNVYGNSEDKKHGDDKVLITVFRKKVL